ncbi:MAG: S46 family peptidase [candidate division KSB1 bacterium]|jgi:hypothetical protein|nr:S46 family peptidase [candidate division KSB1 bacterium]
MRKLYSVILIILLTVSLNHDGSCDEGMWMPHQMELLQLQSQGLEMDPGELYKTDGTGLMSAVVHLGGGTGEFVSKNGLILTNHHVAFSALQRASTTENDYITHGFKAMQRGEEIPAEGYIADVLLGYEDVTDRFERKLTADMSLRERYDLIEQTEKALIAEAEKSGPDIRARVASMYSGNRYYLYRFKRLNDIRLVYAPPRDLGNFGGDIDNWMWPRHTCDFTFLRAYVSPENLGVAYQKDNIPYKPKSFLRIAREGVKENDFTFVIGYPGRTYRNYTHSELLFEIDRFTKRISGIADQIQFLENVSSKDKNIEIKYAGRLKGLNNAMKNYQGKLDGFREYDILDKKKHTEAVFQEWLDAQPGVSQSDKGILGRIQEFTGTYAEFYWRERRLDDLVYRYAGSAMLSQAHLLVRFATEKEKTDEEREPEYQERNWDRLKLRVRIADRSYVPEVDKALLVRQFDDIIQENRTAKPEFLQKAFNRHGVQTTSQLADRLYSNTRLMDVQYRLSLLDKSLNELLALNDPLIDLAFDLENELKTLREESELIAQEKRDLKKIYLEQLLRKTDGLLAPDANSTIRFTSGTVSGYSPRDAVRYAPLTTLGGVIEKDTGEFPFRVPDKLKQLHASGDFGHYADPDLKDVPACFLNTTNVTGGNSGSPTINAKGEQVGIIFDMTYESVIGDYYIIPELQRTISVDTRYVLFITEKFSEMQYIIEEMELKK